MADRIDIGSSLRRAREARGLTLPEIASTTKISTATLAAIERNDFGRLPGGLYRRGYIRAFAAAVGLSADEWARAYHDAFEVDESRKAFVAEQRAESQRRHRRRQAMATCVAACACGVLVLRWWPGERADAPSIPPSRGLAVLVGDRPAPEQPQPALAPAVFADRGLRLEFSLDGPCWLSATADGERVVHRLMGAGDRGVVEADRVIQLRVGDAGRFTYWINGREGRPVGDIGDAVSVRIDEVTAHEWIASTPEGAT